VVATVQHRLSERVRKIRSLRDFSESMDHHQW